MIDLHTHTTISDGSVTPAELVSLAKKQGLTAVAITDHDRIDGHDEAWAAAKELGVTLIKGVEFSVENGDNRQFHILGLGIDGTNPKFQRIYMNFKEERASKMEYVFSELRKGGMDISWDQVAPYIQGPSMDRQALAKYLVASGRASIIKDAWINFLNPIPRIPGELIKAEDAFKAIHAAGGKAFMAHYHLPIGLAGYSDLECRKILGDLKDQGLDGMEFYYPSFTKDDQNRCGEYIKEFDFIKSGGSDYHGSNRPHIDLGTGNVPDYLLENLQ